MALEWPDVDLHKRQLCVLHSEWKGQVTMTKGGRLRYVPMTERLAAVLQLTAIYAVREYSSDRAATPSP
jgi:integrase